MKRISTKKIILIFAVFIFLAFIVNSILARVQKKPVITSPPQIHQVPQSAPREIPWQGITPGMTYEGVIQSKGTPKRFDVSGNTGTIYYPGTNKNWDTEVSIQNNVVTFVREHVFLPQDVSLKSRLASVGGQSIKVYGDISTSGQYVFVFPVNGIAFLANEQNNTVYEVWYFAPGSISEVLSLPQFSGYSTNPNNVFVGN